MVASLTACGDTSAKKDAFVIMTEQLDGLFNPFFYTAAPDGTIVSMTQISMLGAKYEGGKVQVNFKKLENRNVLLPVWFINTWYNNKKCYASCHKTITLIM